VGRPELPGYGPRHDSIAAAVYNTAKKTASIVNDATALWGSTALWAVRPFGQHGIWGSSVFVSGSTAIWGSTLSGAARHLGQ